MPSEEKSHSYSQYEIEELYRLLEQKLSLDRKEAVLRELSNRLRISLEETISQISPIFVSTKNIFEQDVDASKLDSKEDLSLEKEKVTLGELSNQLRASLEKALSDKDDLSSSKGIDYAKLQTLLQKDKWKEADEETFALMLKIAGREGNVLFSELPPTDLRTIDYLWVKYSNRKFGFSIQKKIWQEVGSPLGGVTNWNDSQKKWEDFGDRVGWRVNNSWIMYKDVDFSLESSKGHLPARPFIARGFLEKRIGLTDSGFRSWNVNLGGLEALFSCQGIAEP